jgi:adenylate cyclase
MLWTSGVLLTPFYEYFFLANYPGVLETLPMRGYDLPLNVAVALIWGLMGAGFFAVSELFVINRFLERQPFYKVILIKGGIYFLLLTLLNLFTSYLFNWLASGRSLGDPAIWSDVLEFAGGPSFWHPLIPFILLVFLTLFLMQINQRFGRGELFKLVTGRYFSPKEESRIFMFLDMKDSTTLAEKLGHLVFFDLLNDFFHDITDTILEHGGEIYSYVGDEVIITWTLEKGILYNQCVRCFFEIERLIEERAGNYLHKYQTVPRFKAGIHLGEVTIGEIGKIKKLITYTGDVMNTTARIQSICNRYGEKLIISEDLLQRLDQKRLMTRHLGEVILKGKMQPVGIVAITA